MPDLMPLYNNFPYPLKVIAASIKGYQLQSIRFSKHTDQLVEEAISREKWTADQWKAWQDAHLSSVLQHAAKNVPYYRHLWNERRRKGDHASIEYLENWPLLRKETLRNHSQEFIAENVKQKSLVSDHTSGTTGLPLIIWMGRDVVRNWYALFEARWRIWYGVSRNDRWGNLGGQLVIPFKQSKPPFWVWNAGMNQLYLSTFHISPRFISEYISAIHKYHLLYLYGYASSLYDLARFSLDQKLFVPSIKIVISNAEPLYGFQRETISKAFRCQVVDTYGQSEAICAASECAAGNMHLWPEAGVVEILSISSDQPAPTSEVGRIISTGILNQAMPLIRYEIGDCARLSVTDKICECGRTLPIIESIEGRIDDMIVTRDGRRIEAPDTVFKEDMPILEAQIIQESFDLIRVCVIPASGFNEKTKKMLIMGLHDRVGDMEVNIEEVSTIPRSSSGKRKVIVSKVDKSGLN